MHNLENRNIQNNKKKSLTFSENDVIYDVTVPEFVQLVSSALHHEAGLNLSINEKASVPVLSISLGDVKVCNAYPCSQDIHANESWNETINMSQIKLAVLLPKTGGMEVCNLYNSSKRQKFVYTQQAIEMSEIVDFKHGKVCGEVLSTIVAFIGTYKEITLTKRVRIH